MKDAATLGSRLKLLRKTLKLTQEVFAAALGIDRGHVGNLENNTRKPSQNLLKHICLRYGVSEIWLKKGRGDMFTPPREIIKNHEISLPGTLSESTGRYTRQINEAVTPEEMIESMLARFGKKATVKAFNNTCAPAAAPLSGAQADPELNRMIDTLCTLWTSGDKRLKDWASVQFDRAFPPEMIKKAQE